MTSKTKSILLGTLATLAVVVALGAYSLGYHQGVQVERQAWENTRLTSLNSVTNKGLITQSTRTSYSNPHYSPLPFVAEPHRQDCEDAGQCARSKDLPTI